MLSKRIIACLDVKDGRVVKGVNFSNLKDVDDPVELSKYYSECGIDELVFYDITASNEGRKIFLDVLKKTAENVFIPLTVGGGISTTEDFRRVLSAGADKVSVNSGAIKNPSLIKEASLLYGRQCIVLSVDVKRVNSNFHVFLNGGRIDTSLDALDWIEKGVLLGAGEVVVNSIDTDGVKNGFDEELMYEVSKRVDVPLIASGGAGKKKDFVSLFKNNDRVDAALAASIFHKKEVNIRDLKENLKQNNIDVRITNYDRI